MPRERVFKIIERTTEKNGKKTTKIYARTSYKGRDGRRHTLWRQGDTRTEAKERRDFAAADRIRDELKAEGILLEDTPSGTTWRRE